MSQQEPWETLGITEVEYWERKYSILKTENHVLQAENNTLSEYIQFRLKSIQNENQKLQSELALAKERLGPAVVKMLERMKASEAENEKLKAELGCIAWTPKRNGDCGQHVAMSIELAREIEAVVDTLRRATWHDTVEGHAVVGRHSWERIQNALERLDAITKGDGG